MQCGSGTCKPAMGIPCWSAGPVINTGRHMQVGYGRDVVPSAVGSHVDGRAYAGLTGIVLEAALDSSFPYGCFGFLLGRGTF